VQVQYVYSLGIRPNHTNRSLPLLQGEMLWLFLSLKSKHRWKLFWVKSSGNQNGEKYLHFDPLNEKSIRYKSEFKKAIKWKRLKKTIYCYSHIAVDRFLKRTLSFDWFLKHALSLDRFFIGGIDLETSYFSPLLCFTSFRCMKLLVLVITGSKYENIVYKKVTKESTSY